MDTATALWILLPLALIHLSLARRRSALAFQLAVDLALLVLPLRQLGGGAHLGAGVPTASQWGAPAQLAGSPEQTDLPLESGVWFEEVRRLVAAGQPPWVSDRIGGGVPLFANGQTTFPVPLQLPIWALGTARGTDVVTVWRLEAAALGAFLLLLRLGVRPAAAAAAGFAFGLNLYLISWATVALGWVVAATPWAWRALVGTLRGCRREAALLAVLLGVLAGWCVNPGTAVFLWLGIGLGGAVLAWGSRRRVRRLAATFALAVPIAALGALPTLGYISGSAKLAQMRERPQYPMEMVDWSLRGRLAALLLVPWRDGHPADGTWHFPFASAAVEVAAGAALVTVALAVRQRRRHRRHVAAVLAVGAVAACLLWQLPGVAHLAARVPGLGVMTWPRCAFLIPFSVSVLGALALDAWRHRPVRRAAWMAVVAVQAVVAALAVTSVAGAGHRVGVTVLAPAAVGVALSLPPPAAALAVPALVLAEQVASAWSVLPSSSRVDRQHPPPLVAALRRRQAAEGGRVLGTDGALPPNLAASWGLEDLRSHDPMRPRQLASLHAAFGSDTLDLIGPLTTPWASLAGAWGVRWLVTPAGGPVGPAGAGWERVDATADGKIYRNPRALDVVRLATRTVPPPGNAASGAWEGVEFADTAVAAEALAVAGSGSLTVRERLPHRVSARVEARGTVLAVLHVPLAPGWSAVVDGERVDVHVVNVAAMGVLVRDGCHEVRWRYDPTGWRWGLGLTLAGLLASVILAAGWCVQRW